MRTLKEKRIKLLQEVREIVGKSADPDRGLYDRGARRESRRVDKIIKELADWVKDLQQKEILDEVQQRIDKENRKERKKYDNQRVSWYQ